MANFSAATKKRVGAQQPPQYEIDSFDNVVLNDHERESFLLQILRCRVFSRRIVCHFLLPSDGTRLCLASSVLNQESFKFAIGIGYFVGIPRVVDYLIDDGDYDGDGKKEVAYNHIYDWFKSEGFPTCMQYLSLLAEQRLMQKFTNNCMVAAGGCHNIICLNGQLYSAGRGRFGATGQGSRRNSPVFRPFELGPLPRVGPLPATLARRVAQVAAGDAHALFLTAAGAVLSCGQGDMGRLGHGNEEHQLTPREVRSLRGRPAAAVAAGAAHSLALHRDGGASAWGWGLHGQLFTDDRLDQLTPKEVDVAALCHLGEKDFRRVRCIHCVGNVSSLCWEKDGKVGVVIAGEMEYSRKGYSIRISEAKEGRSNATPYYVEVHCNWLLRGGNRVNVQKLAVSKLGNAITFISGDGKLIYASLANILASSSTHSPAILAGDIIQCDTDDDLEGHVVNVEASSNENFFIFANIKSKLGVLAVMHGEKIDSAVSSSWVKQLSLQHVCCRDGDVTNGPPWLQLSMYHRSSKSEDSFLFSAQHGGENDKQKTTWKSDRDNSSTSALNNNMVLYCPWCKSVLTVGVNNYGQLGVGTVHDSKDEFKQAIVL